MGLPMPISSGLDSSGGPPGRRSLRQELPPQVRRAGCTCTRTTWLNSHTHTHTHTPRWHNQLDPSVNKLPFTEWEQAVIFKVGTLLLVGRQPACGLLQGRLWHLPAPAQSIAPQ